MPLGPGVKYRVKTTSSGKRVRLAFKRGSVIEAKNIDTGARHTPAEFAANRARSRGSRSMQGRVLALRGAGKFRGD